MKKTIRLFALSNLLFLFSPVSADINDGGTPPATFAGLQYVTLASAGPGTNAFVLSLVVACDNPTDYISCNGTLFANNGTFLTTYSAQGSCVAGIFNAGSFISPQTNCTPTTFYNLNLICINQTTRTATSYAPDGSSTATFQCE